MAVLSFNSASCGTKSVLLMIIRSASAICLHNELTDKWKDLTQLSISSGLIFLSRFWQKFCLNIKTRGTISPLPNTAYTNIEKNRRGQILTIYKIILQIRDLEEQIFYKTMFKAHRTTNYH